MEKEELFLQGINFNSAESVKQLNPLVMAFVGDCVHTLYIKTNVINLYSAKVNTLNKNTAKIINAKAQQQALFKIMDRLTENEIDIVKRARNTNIHSKAKNFSIEEYRYATAFEALIGYLYLSKQFNRLQELLQIAGREEN